MPSAAYLAVIQAIALKNKNDGKVKVRVKLHEGEQILFEDKPDQGFVYYWVLSRLWHILVALIVLFLLVYINLRPTKIVTRLNIQYFIKVLRGGILHRLLLLSTIFVFTKSVNDMIM